MNRLLKARSSGFLRFAPIALLHLLVGLALIAALFVLLAGCSAPRTTLTVLAGSELRDLEPSNSAAMYLALMSYVANQNNIVQSLDQARPQLPLLTDMFLRRVSAPAAPGAVADYLVKGMGHSPIVIIYEAQYVARQPRQRTAVCCPTWC